MCISDETPSPRSLNPFSIYVGLAFVFLLIAQSECNSQAVYPAIEPVYFGDFPPEAEKAVQSVLDMYNKQIHWSAAVSIRIGFKFHQFAYTDRGTIGGESKAFVTQYSDAVTGLPMTADIPVKILNTGKDVPKSDLQTSFKLDGVVQDINPREERLHGFISFQDTNWKIVDGQPVATEKLYDFSNEGISIDLGGGNFDFLPFFRTLVAHEVAHSLGFGGYVFKKEGELVRLEGPYDHCLSVFPPPFEDLQTPWITLVNSEMLAVLNGALPGGLCWAGWIPSRFLTIEMRGNVRNFMSNHTATSGVLNGGYVLMHNRNVYEPSSTYCHWSTQHFAGRLILAHASSENIQLTSNDITPLALQDIGYSLVDNFLNENPINFWWSKPASSKSNDPVSKTLEIWNYSEDSMTLYEVKLVGEGEAAFSIVGSPIVDVPIAPNNKLDIEFEYNPISPSMAFSLARLKFSTATGEMVKYIELNGHFVDSDADGDMISDYNETRDLNDVTPGSQNPFNQEERDTVSNHGEDAADGVVDGFNDYDGDGYSNLEEFLRGHNPTDDSDYPAGPVENGLTYEFVTVSNPFEWDMEIRDIEVAGTDSRNYVVYGDSAGFRKVKAGESTKVWVAFVPESTGVKDDAILKVHYNNGTGSKVTEVSLEGIGVSGE